MRQDIDCELCVSAIDARGQELLTCTRLSQRGSEKTCRPCVVGKKNFTLEPSPPSLCSRGESSSPHSE